jgi:thiamine biosynthesis lipoprotein
VLPTAWWRLGRRFLPNGQALRYLAALAAAAWLTSAALTRQTSLERFEFTQPHMGTTFAIVLYGENAGAARRAAAAAFERIASIDGRLTDYRDDSEAMVAAREAVGRPVRVSDDLYRVLSSAVDMSASTACAFDVTVGPLTRVWRRARRQGELPDPTEIAAARAVTGCGLVRLDRRSHTVTFERAGMRLDFGGIAKGYAADRALDVLRREGVSQALVAAGGDVAVGNPPAGARGWRVAIAPFAERVPAATPEVLLAHRGISTSGDAEQWVTIDGVRYSHILDPRTGQPLTGHRQVTVVARDATTSDMLATAVSVLGPSKGLQLVDRMAGAAGMFGTTDGQAPVRWAFSRRWQALRQ